MANPSKYLFHMLIKLPPALEAPTYSVVPMNLIIPSDQIRDSLVKISDFGTSFLLGDKLENLHTPTILLPPEAFFHEKISSSADVWTLGCTLYDILGERPLFETWSGPDDVIGEMVSTLGPLPARWWDKWENRKDSSLRTERGIQVTNIFNLQFSEVWRSACSTWGGERLPRLVSSRGKR